MMEIPRRSLSLPSPISWTSVLPCGIFKPFVTCLQGTVEGASDLLSPRLSSEDISIGFPSRGHTPHFLTDRAAATCSDGESLHNRDPRGLRMTQKTQESHLALMMALNHVFFQTQGC